MVLNFKSSVHLKQESKYFAEEYRNSSAHRILLQVDAYALLHTLCFPNMETWCTVTVFSWEEESLVQVLDLRTVSAFYNIQAKYRPCLWK